MSRPSLKRRLQECLGGASVPQMAHSVTSYCGQLAGDPGIDKQLLAAFIDHELWGDSASVGDAEDGASAARLEAPDRRLLQGIELAVGHSIDRSTEASGLYYSDEPWRLTIRDELYARYGDAFQLRYLPRSEAQAALAQTIADDDEQLFKTILPDFDSDATAIEVVDTYDLNDEGADADGAPIIKLLNHIFLKAFQSRASDIHLEAEESVTRVRFRIDGELHEIMHPPKRFHSAIVSRIKIMSDLDIAERRAPQDGRMKLRVANSNIDVRVSTIPSVYGEKVVMRVLDESGMQLSLERLGFTEDQIERYLSIVTKPYGIVLVTGPTGSGKTTTLYSTLNHLNSKSKNIITIEDPVEYQMENINQIQVNRRAGIDFASGLKSILRQDPDIIMLGEMRDEETATTAIKAALTGHLVLSTLHTNDAAGAFERLQDMGVAPYLLASAVSGVIAQRLVRLICPDCSVPHQPDPSTLKLLGLSDKQHEYRHGAGCPNCAESGYRGRSAIYEILTPNQEVKKQILSGQLVEGAEVPGIDRMIDHGITLVASGRTTAEELCKVVRVREIV